MNLLAQRVLALVPEFYFFFFLTRGDEIAFCAPSQYIHPFNKISCQTPPMNSPFQGALWCWGREDSKMAATALAAPQAPLLKLSDLSGHIFSPFNQSPLILVLL